MRHFPINIGLTLLSVLALSACGGSADEAASGETDNVAETAVEETPNPVRTDDANGEGGIGAGTVETALSNRIPTRFHGAWDYVEGTCALESDLRMEISGSEILFYESIGTVTTTSPDGDDVIVTLAMEGEGETWEEQTRLSLVGAGDDQRLETSDGEAPKVTDEYPSKRCPE